MTIELPWPPSELSPNARGHWRKGYRAQQGYKDLCLWTMLGKRLPKFEGDDRIPLTITFHPPDNRRRDRDNMQSALKYGLDALASKLGVDDYRFDPSYRFADPVKGGRVLVEVSE